METYIFYTIIFIIGITFGSFFTLAIHRIPKSQNITNERSYCPKCNHKLEFLDLIPVLSYIALKGKCRYCGEKIRVRYILLEVFAGIMFLLLAIILKINIYELNITRIVTLICGMLFISAIIILIGIYKETREINKKVLLFGVIVGITYIIYLWVFNNIYGYVV